MKFIHLTTIFLINVCPLLAYADEVTPEITDNIYNDEDVSLRFHDQWSVDEGAREKLQKAFYNVNITYDRKGHPTPHGLAPVEAKRWERLYMLCMSDGCYYCDASEGSCELGTCGPNNESCRPHIGQDGMPLCSQVCTDYAFNSILICNDRS